MVLPHEGRKASSLGRREQDRLARYDQAQPRRCWIEKEFRPSVARSRRCARFPPAVGRNLAGGPLPEALDHSLWQAKLIRITEPACIERLGQIQAAIEEVPGRLAAMPQKTADRLVSRLVIGGALLPLSEQVREIAFVVDEPSSRCRNQQLLEEIIQAVIRYPPMSKDGRDVPLAILLDRIEERRQAVVLDHLLHHTAPANLKVRRQRSPERRSDGSPEISLAILTHPEMDE